MSDAPITAPVAATTTSNESTPKPSNETRTNRVSAPLSDSNDKPKESNSSEPKSEPKKETSEKKEPGKEDKSEPVSEAKKEEKKEAERRKYKLNVNGRESEREFTDEEIQRRLQTWEAIDEKSKKASEIESQMKNFVQALKSDPLAVLEKLGLGDKLDELSEKRLTTKVKNELMSPEERELAELREFRRQSEERQKAQEEEGRTKAEQAQFEEHRSRATKYYDEKITEVLNQSDLPRTPFTIKRIAEVLYSALSKGYELDINTAVDMVRDGYMSDIQSMFGDVPPEKMLKILGPELAKKIRQHDIAQLKARKSAIVPSTPAEQVSQIMEQNSTPRQSNRGEKKKLNHHEWIESIRRKGGVD
jgi:hypothetical protein